MDSDFEAFVRTVLAQTEGKAGQAAAFVWWAEKREYKQSVSMDQICEYFLQARLPQPNRTRLDQDLRKEGYVSRDKSGNYQLSRSGIYAGEELFSGFIKKDASPEVVSEIDVRQCAYIAETDIADAQRMAALYVSLFCLENSLRRHIQKKILSVNLGQNWWDIAASNSMKRKEEDRRNNEVQNKWIPSRSSLGPLYALDWTDLATLIRKYENLFSSSIPDLNFLHRFSDLGNLRNVVAHNGVIDEPMQFKRVELAIHDWAKQVSE